MKGWQVLGSLLFIMHFLHLFAANIHAQVQDLQHYIDIIEKQQKIILQQEKVIAEQAARIVALENEVKKLKEKVRILKEGKNSNNSSIPPSADQKRTTNKSLRTKTGKKTGGQPGHKGSTLKMTDNPDQVVKHTPSLCDCCGEDISDKEEVLKEKRQVVDIPPIKPVYVEHRVFVKKCTCGHETSSAFPEDVKASIQYGAGVEGLVAYLSARHYVPFARTGEILGHVFGLPLSEGSIGNILERFAKKAQEPYKRIKEDVAKAPVVGSDETGCKVNGEKLWVFTWQDPENTFLSISKSRGNVGIAESFPDGFPMSTLISDAWAAQLATLARRHQLCTAHLLRDLKYFVEVLHCSWAEDIKKLFEDALKLKKDWQDELEGNFEEKRKGVFDRFDKLLKQSVVFEKVKPFKKRLQKNKESVFEFLNQKDVPPDNNASERAIRNIKVKLKVSGQFRSLQGAQCFLTIRSVIDTAIKRGCKVLDVLKDFDKLSPAE
ncbi:IS66 family transposase [Cytophagaceae bacterium ABcell3]|nr:IS66 family transposase [Cytophagaceae bacterium ABcell3]